MIKHIRKTYSLDRETVQMLEWLEQKLQIRYSALLRELIREKHDSVKMEESDGSLL